MKSLSWIVAAALLAGAAVTPAFAEKAKEKAKAYPLEICLVSDEKLGEDPDMKPFSFSHAGQEIKLCCKSCKKDFDKDPKKFMAKLEDEAKKAKNEKKSGK